MRTTSGQRTDEPLDWRTVIPTIAAVFVASRVLLIVVASLVEAYVPLTDPTKAWSSAPILTSLTTSDAVYYLGIAANGYHVLPVSGPYHDYVFFPLYPLLVRLASVLTLGDIAVAGVLVANGAFLVALVLLYRLMTRYLDHDTAILAIVFLVTAPGSVAFAMAYSEGLFLLLVIAAFLAAEGRRYPLMGLVYGLAALTRLPGLFLAIPLVLQLVADGGRRPTRHWLWLLAGPLALACFYAYLGVLTGDPLANLHGQAAWDAPAMAPATGGSIETRSDPLFLILAAVLIVYAFLFVYARPDRTPIPHAAWAVTVFASVFVGGRILSAPRYLVVAWPFAGWLAGRRAGWFRAAWPIVWLGLFGLFAFLNFTTTLAP
ncbi:MAG: hypothetical protein QOF11_453 [Chloroflexota bacterium]|nr:hypothetical protein [Chloroflexota bacterium]